MKVKDLIEQLKYYNQDADVYLNSSYKHIGFTLAFGGGDGVEKENCETVSIYPDDLGCESSQTERRYSGEEVKSAFKIGFFIGYGNPVNGLDSKDETCEEWFEKFKKK